jgi:hypothetical protein
VGAILEIEPKALHMLGKHSTTGLHSQPFCSYFDFEIVSLTLHSWPPIHDPPASASSVAGITDVHNQEQLHFPSWLAFKGRLLPSFLTFLFIFVLFCFCGTVSHTCSTTSATPPALLYVGYFQDRVSRTICLSWLRAVTLLISASPGVRITGVSHQCSACFSLKSLLKGGPLFVCVCGTGAWTQGLHLESLHQFFFVMGYFS